MSEKTLLMPHELLCNMYWLNHLDGISLHLQCPKVEASQPNKTKGINEVHTVLTVKWFNFVAVSVDFLQSGIARFFSVPTGTPISVCFFFYHDNFNKNFIILSFRKAFIANKINRGYYMAARRYEISL